MSEVTWNWNRFVLIGADGALKMGLPFTEKSFYFGASGELFAVGVKAEIEDGVLTIGVSDIIGGSLSIGIVD